LPMVGTPNNTEKNSDGAPLAHKPVARETSRSLVKRAFQALAKGLCAQCRMNRDNFFQTSPVGHRAQ
jgi:hypothetical protein